MQTCVVRLQPSEKTPSPDQGPGGRPKSGSFDTDVVLLATGARRLDVTSLARGHFVVVVGPDGVGKTTFAHAIADRLGSRCKYFHFLPRPLWRLSDRPGKPGELVEKYSGEARRLLGWVRLARNVIKSWFAYWITIRPTLRSGVTVVGDRYLYGYIAQPTPLKFFGPGWLARLALRLIPKPDLVVVLDAPADVIHGRKPELASDVIEAERRIWQHVSPNVVVLDSRRPSAALVDELFVALRLSKRS